MRSILPIYKLTLRSILRERVALSMLALLALVLLLLPAGLETDGTIQGALRMHIRYSLGFSSFLLAAMTIWASCAAVAGDLSSKRLQMVLTKPVSRTEIWWGKWLAVVTLVSCLLLICGGVTYLRVQRMIHAEGLSPDEKAKVYSQQLTSRRPVDPLKEDFSEKAKELANEQIASGVIPPSIPEDAVISEMKRFLLVSSYAASAGESASWTFHLKKPLQAGQTIQLGYGYDGSAMGVSQIPGVWKLGTEEATSVFIKETFETPYGEKVIPIRVSPEMAGAKTLTLSFENLNKEGGRVFFKTDKGVRIFFQAGGFIMNLFRALLLLSGLLAILAAIGVSAGSIFSLPVACYVSAVVLMLQAFSGIVEEVVEAGPEQRQEEQSILSYGINQFQYRVYQGVLIGLKPLQVESPLGRVSRGVLISPVELLKIFCLRFAPIVLLISGGGILLFSKREIGASV